MRKYSSQTKTANNDLRSDALLKREAIVRTAQKMYAKYGADISLSEIAKAAKVSRPTLYRNFPDNSSIALAVFEYNLDELEKTAKKLEKETNVFFKLLNVVAHQQVIFHSLIPHIIPDKKNLKAVEEIDVRLHKIFEKPVAQAKKDGQIRSDLSVKKDIDMILMMLGGALTNVSDKKSSVVAKRAMTLILEGLKPKNK